MSTMCKSSVQGYDVLIHTGFTAIRIIIEMALMELRAHYFLDFQINFKPRQASELLFIQFRSRTIKIRVSVIFHYLFYYI